MVLTEDFWNSAIIGRSTPHYTDVAVPMRVPLTDTSINLTSGQQSNQGPEMEFASTYEHHRRFSVPPVSKVGERCRSLISVETAVIGGLPLNTSAKMSLPTLTTCSSSDAIETSSNSDDVIVTDVFAINCPPDVQDPPQTYNYRNSSGFQGHSSEFQRAAADVKSNRKKKTGPDVEPRDHRLFPSISNKSDSLNNAPAYDKKRSNNIRQKPPVTSVTADTPRLAGGKTPSSNTINRLHQQSTSGRPLQPAIANVNEEPNATKGALAARNPCALCKQSTVRRKQQVDAAVNMRKWKSQQTLALPRLPNSSSQRGTNGKHHYGNATRPANGGKGSIPNDDAEAAAAAGRRSSADGRLTLRNNCSSPSTTQRVALWLIELDAAWPFDRPPSQLINDEDSDRRPHQTDTAIHIVYSGD